MNTRPIPRWRVVAQELVGAAVTNLIIASPKGEILTLAGTTDKTRAAIREFVKEHESMRDARFSDTTELAKFLDGLYLLTENGVTITNQKWPEAQKLVETLQALDTGAPPDWMRILVIKEFRERLALPYTDEASIGPWELFEDLLRETGLAGRVVMLRALQELALTDGSDANVSTAEVLARRVRSVAQTALDEGKQEGPAVWLTSDFKAYGRVSDEQIVEVLRGALADVERRSGLSCPDEGCPHYGTRHGHPDGPLSAEEAASFISNPIGASGAMPLHPLEIDPTDPRDNVPHWVPVAERLPEHGDEVPVTAETDSGRVISSAYYDKKRKAWNHEGEFTFQHGYFFEVVAWLDGLQPSDTPRVKEED